MRNLASRILTIFGIAVFGFSLSNSGATAASPKTHLVIQVSSADPTVQKIALNNAVNV